MLSMNSSILMLFESPPMLKKPPLPDTGNVTHGFSK